MSKFPHPEGGSSAPALRPRSGLAEFIHSGTAQRAEDSRTAETLFYTGFLPLLFVLLWKTTAFPQYEKAELLAMAFFTGCAALKMLLCDRWSLKEIIFLVLSLAVAGLSYYRSGFTRPLVVVIAVWGAKDLDGRKLLKVWLVMSVLNLVLSMSAALLGIIENFAHPKNEDETAAELVYSLGITNTTDCAARVFFTMLVWFYLRGEQLKWFEYAAAAVLAFGIYRVTGGRIDSGCIAIMTLLFLTVNAVRGTAKKSARYRMESSSGQKGQAVSVLAFLSIPAGAAVSLLLCRIYRPDGIWQKIDKWSSGRLSIGHKTFLEHSVKLFGQPIEMYGNGRGGYYTNQYREDTVYSFIDISYQSVLMLYGVFFFILMTVLYLFTVWRFRKDVYLMLCVLLIAFNCMFAHHLTELAYIPFVLLAFTKEPSSARSNTIKQSIHLEVL